MRSKRVDARTPTPPKRVQLFSRGRYLSEKEQKYLISRGQRPDRRLRHPWAAPPTLAWRSMHRLRPAAPRLSLERERVTRGGRRRAATPPHPHFLLLLAVFGPRRQQRARALYGAEGRAAHDFH